MGRHVLAVVVVAVAAGPALAGPKKKVQIESEPPGAAVYVGTVEEGEVCRTPCAIQVENDTLVIVDLAGYKPEIEAITFGRRERAPKRSFTLVASLGKILVKGPRGARVTIDDEDKGKAPVDVDVNAGPHAVTLELDGKKIYEEAVEVAAGAEIEVTGPDTTVAEGPILEDDPDPPPDDDTNRIGKVATPPRAPRKGPIVAVSAVASVGFRDFKYENPVAMPTINLDSSREVGQINVGPVVELWPGTLFGVGALRELSLVGRAQFGVNPQEVTDNDGNNIGAQTFWRNFEASLRYRLVLGGVAALGASAGYLRDQHQFSGDVAKVPDADYQSVKIALRLSALLGAIEPYAVGENLVVMSGGKTIEDRFMDNNVSGLSAAVGLAARFGSIAARFEASITRYSWTFRNGEATGALDSIKYLSFFVGYAY